MYLPDVPNIYLGNTAVTAMYLGDTLVWPKQNVEIVYGIRQSGSTYSNNRIWLNFNTSSTLKVQTKFKLLAAIQGVAFGGVTNNENNDYKVNNANGEYRCDIGSARLTYTKSRILETFEIGNYYLKDMVNNTILVSGDTQVAPTLRYTVNIGYMEFYWLKAYDGDTLIFDGVSAKCNGLYGIYDRLSGRFFSATDRPNDVIPVYEPCCYIAPTGLSTDFITITGTTTNATAEYRLKFRPLGSTGLYFPGEYVTQNADYRVFYDSGKLYFDLADKRVTKTISSGDFFDKDYYWSAKNYVLKDLDTNEVILSSTTVASASVPVLSIRMDAGYMRIYGFEIWENGVQTMNLVPVRYIDGRGFLYDTKTEEVYMPTASSRVRGYDCP